MPSAQPPPPLALQPPPIFSQSLFDELVSLVRGPVCWPTDPEYAERAKTFNGKLKPRCRVLVSPLNAQDVSAVIKFCLKHKLSPSVRAGGYAIPGWAVSGDVLVDMSMLRDIAIEPPLNVPEGTKVDWTPLKDTPIPDSDNTKRPLRTDVWAFLL
ncbi:uncharacterized protein BXZ73DRAFT_100527 [Epithele typhae]|uniref:uncharacterized protein n=1 Tax=Epithele typhae TaxID=378194 RepID=UPI002008008C|nr:uncharacterized protein BXZ73DRAFT_100527 [Epithele typhae]KAH9935138.1 hypothetical protein BXZ73DRAFT_100527 [Epithele typhae]